MSECATQETYGNNELCRFHTGSEPKSRSMSTQSERVTRDLRIKTHYKNPLDTLRVSTGGLKGKKIMDHRVRGQNVIFCLLTTKKSTVSDKT